MAQKRASIYPLVLVYAGPTTLYVQELHGVSIKPGTKKDVITVGGAIDPNAVILQNGEPQVNVKSHDVSTLLTAISLTAGLQCAAGSNLVQFQTRADGGTFAGTSSHVVLTNKKLFAIPKRLSASQDRPAELDLDLWLLYDGTLTTNLPTPPLTIAVSQTLTSTPAFNGEYYAGPVYANAVQVPSIKDWEIDFGIEYKTLTLDGDLWPQTGSIISRKPKLSFTCTDPNVISTVGSFWNAALPGALAFYLRQGSAGAARTADSGSGAIKISAATGAWDVQDASGDGQDDAMFKVSADITGTLSATLGTTIP